MLTGNRKTNPQTREPVRDAAQHRRLRIPSHNTVSTLSMIPQLQNRNRKAQHPTPFRVGRQGQVVFAARLVGALLAATASVMGI